MRNLLLSDRARRDLKGIWRYSLAHWGEARATRYLLDLEEGMRKLARKPKSGKPRDLLRAGYLSKRLLHHVVFYTFDDRELRVRRVLHEVMEEDLHL